MMIEIGVAERLVLVVPEVCARLSFSERGVVIVLDLDVFDRAFLNVLVGYPQSCRHPSITAPTA